MAAKTFGTAHLYGIAGTIANATVLSFSLGKGHGVEDSTVDENGIEIERRYDDVQEEGSITIRMQAAYTEPAVGTTVAYNAVTYEITKVDRSEESKGFRTLTLSIKKSEGIAYV